MSIPSVRQVDKHHLTSVIRQQLAASWATNDRLQRGRVLCDTDRERHHGMLVMSRAICRSIGCDADTINTEAARLARSVQE
jgi:hypothetical protein